MIPSRRLPALIVSGMLGIALFSNGLFMDRADGQKKAPSSEPIPAGSPAGFSSVKFIENQDIRRIVNVGRSCIKDGDWKQAVEALQAVLSEKKDYYVRVSERDPANGQQEITRWTSAKFEASNLIGSMPAKGLEAYESAHGAEAKTMLDDAKKKNDRALLFEVAMRFRHTKAGTEAHKSLSASKVIDIAKERYWPSWRGNATNTAQANGSLPLLDKLLWKRPLFMDKIEGFDKVDPDQTSQARVKAAIEQANAANQAVMPGFFPIASQGVLVYRSQRDVRAVALKPLELLDGATSYKYKAGEILWKSMSMDHSLAALLNNPRTRAKTEQWIDAYHKVPGYTSFLYDNTLLGSLSTDHRLVYAINDLAVPPIPSTFIPWAWNNPQLNPGADMKSLMRSNELHAYDLENGKCTWVLNETLPQFKDSHFLSQPILVGGKLYVMNEKNLSADVGVGNPGLPGKPNQMGNESELRLVCIDPTKVTDDGKPSIIEPIQVLANVAPQNRMVQDVSRRVNGIQLAYADGVLVCPTNAGELFGIDLMTRTLAWSYPYRESAHQPIVLPGEPLPQPKGVTTISKWRSSPPAIQDGKIVFTAPDADSVHCVQLRDGKRVWKHIQQKGDLYMAGVFAGRVLIVSDKHIRALDLKNGTQLWTITLAALPTGQGAASKMIYYLPLKTGILAVDIGKGEIKGHNRLPAGAAPPGNLVFYENMVLSQSPTDVTAYPQSKATD